MQESFPINPGYSSATGRVDETALSLRDILYVLFSHIKLIIFLFIATTVIVTATLSIWPETYESTAKILLLGNRSNVPVSPLPASKSQVITTTGVRPEAANSEIEILHNYHIVEQLIDNLGVDSLTPPAVEPVTPMQKLKHVLKTTLHTAKKILNEFLYTLNLKKRLSPREGIILQILERLQVKQVPGSDVIEVSLRWGNPEIATQILKKLLDQYLNNHMQARQTPKAYPLLKKQVDLIENRLRDADTRIRNIKQKLGITSIDDRAAYLDKQLSELEKSLVDIRVETAQMTGKLTGIREKLQRTPSSINKAEIQQLEVYLKELKFKERALKKQHETYRKEADQLNKHGAELKRLKRQIPVDAENAKYYRTRLEEARINELLDKQGIINVRIIAPPRASMEPVKPKKLLLIYIAMAVSLIAGIGFAFLSDYFDHSLRRGSDVKKQLGLPLLASVPELH